MIDTLAAAIVGHVVGDYLLQNDRLALNKKKSTVICLIHVFFYTAAVAAFTGWWVSWQAILSVFIPHFLIDRFANVMTYAKWTGQTKFVTGPCAPWSIIMIDNAWHLVCLWVTAGIWSAGGFPVM